MTDCIICDIDGTLAISNTPWPGKNATTKQWLEFLDPDRLAGLEPIEKVWQAVARLDMPTAFITGRPLRTRKPTERWLTTHAKTYNIHTILPAFMRENGNLSPSHRIKWELLQIARKRGLNPIIAFEDDPADIEIYRNAGLTVIQPKDIQ